LLEEPLFDDATVLLPDLLGFEGFGASSFALSATVSTFAGVSFTVALGAGGSMATI